ncbi:MAG: cytochrome c-type biogenesis protein CcmH [Dehalococcoidia bacterium]|nr:cytochrome c-type biogenesis protein CcmH [Dehalococcoidia bacterium]
MVSWQQRVGLGQRAVSVFFSKCRNFLQDRLVRLSASLFLLALFLGLACTSPFQMADPMERQAQEIERGLICPICPGESIDQSQVPLAKQMRTEVREELQAGKTKQQIFDYFAAPERYGPSVLASPPRSGFNVLAWMVPVGVLALGGLMLYWALKSMRKRINAPDSTVVLEETDPTLAPYLAQVDSTQVMSPRKSEEASDTRGR